MSKATDESSDVDDSGFTPWTSEGAARLRAAAREAGQALLDHAERVASLSGHDQVNEVFGSAEQLAASMVALADAQFEFTGTTAPLGGVYQYLEDEDESGEDEESAPVRGISVFRRHDYEVLDEAAVITAGQQAYLRIWEDASTPDAEAHANHLGAALYQLAHAGGTWDALVEVEALRVTGAVALVVPTAAVLGPDPDSWPETLFDVDVEEALFGESDVYPAS